MSGTQYPRNPAEELQKIENQLTILKSNLHDQAYCDNPIRARTDLDKHIIEKKATLDEHISTINLLKEELQKLQNNPHSMPQSKLNLAIKKTNDEANKENKCLELSFEEYEKLASKHKKYCENDYIKYSNLFKKRYLLNIELGIQQENLSADFRAAGISITNAGINLAKITAKLLNEESMWFDKFKRKTGFELSVSNTNDYNKIGFSSLDGKSIFVSKDSVQYNGIIPDKSKSEIALALILLFLKTTENSNNTSCAISDQPQEIITYIEKMFAEVIRQKMPNVLSSYSINGITAEDILKRPEKSMKSGEVVDVPIDTIENNPKSTP